MHHPSKSLDYHHRGASPRLGRPLTAERLAVKISAATT
jgi:hypothetical protein